MSEIYQKGLRRIWVSVEKTVQAKQFEPVKVVAGMSSDIGDDADIDKEFSKCWDEVCCQVFSGLGKMLP